MNKSILTGLFEHNNWANLQIIQACSSLSEEQLDAEPQTITKGSIRSTLQHLINSQEDYLSQLMGIESCFNWQTPPDFDELRQAATDTGEGLIALTRDESSNSLQTKFEKDGYSVEPWLVLVQAINHATEHREQIKSMLSNLGITPPRIDGWAYGRITNALVQLSS
ncbi:MAG: DinB family protein [Anaerolineales bacterium]|nr:DinB family protein [Anaerolineales bacterium]